MTLTLPFQYHDVQHTEIRFYVTKQNLKKKAFVSDLLIEKLDSLSPFDPKSVLCDYRIGLRSGERLLFNLAFIKSAWLRLSFHKDGVWSGGMGQKTLL